eukprot:Lithocolla_globosa_v1_NODE_1387_length_2613_cov_119.390387.p3 type:complete len:107 gc:universal NODE_1387_length_2613_cov_119.390387:742-1062(+)
MSALSEPASSDLSYFVFASEPDFGEEGRESVSSSLTPFIRIPFIPLLPLRCMTPFMSAPSIELNLSCLKKTMSGIFGLMIAPAGSGGDHIRCSSGEPPLGVIGGVG